MHNHAFKYVYIYTYIYMCVCVWKHYLHIIRRQVTAPSMAAACMAACRRTCAVGTEHNLVTNSWLLNYGHWVVDLPNLNMVIFHSSVTVYQRVNYSISPTWNKASYRDDPSYYQWGHSEVTVRSQWGHSEVTIICSDRRNHALVGNSW